MKFKILALSIALFSALCFAGCESSTSENSSDGSSVQVEEESSSAETIPAGEFTVSGDGTVYLSTAGGTTEDGNVPVVSASSDTQIKQIGLNSNGYDGTMMSYIYIDGKLVTKEQLADTQSTLDLSGDSIKEGTHKVEVVQYTGDEVSADNVATYQTMQYEIKY